MIKFRYYKDTSPDIQKEAVANNVCSVSRTHLDLPDVIEIEFVQMGPSTYGETIVDLRYPNRIRINLDLTITDIIIPIVHELVHLEQIKQGRLACNRFGDLIWEGKKYKMRKSISHREYTQLPWEVDVVSRQTDLLNKVLNSL